MTRVLLCITFDSSTASNMKLREHPYGTAYYHKPTGKVVYLQNKYSDGSYSAHFQFREQLTVTEDELEYATKAQVEKYYTYKVL